MTLRIQMDGECSVLFLIYVDNICSVLPLLLSTLFIMSYMPFVQYEFLNLCFVDVEI